MLRLRIFQTDDDRLQILLIVSNWPLASRP